MTTRKLTIYLAILTFISCLVGLSQTEDSLTRCRRASESTCVLTPDVTQGPYYWNSTLKRKNITEDREGIALRLKIFVISVNTCLPIVNAAVSIWHCDAAGIYSHYIQASENVQNPQNDNQTFLRGIQKTNKHGVAIFDTIYPGWYIGRSIHIHVRVFQDGEYVKATGYYSDAAYVQTGQLFFNDSFSDLVMEQSPYSDHTGTRLQNSEDNIYAVEGSYTQMVVQYVNSEVGITGGLITSVTLGVSSNATEHRHKHRHHG